MFLCDKDQIDGGFSLQRLAGNCSFIQFFGMCLTLLVWEIKAADFFYILCIYLTL